MGGSNSSLFNGAWDTALTNELVIVSFNYRVGIFGFLAGNSLRGLDPASNSTGNMGTLDQRLALQWTQKNIRSFGGDPDRVMLVGESAGANSVYQHLARPKSWGLFQRAAVESGCGFTPAATEEEFEKQFQKQF